ncbi:hypothetical protein RGQ29_000154 [Quercus rubra]|uniref:Integrase catalytic domain-containing protein n=1 Tax=Quercus rubra TaxID=3512 RepID=A0AAN7GDV9_QUERU|nr:hypothetical protein RGQ29_000154 [Quercus rubra]
MATYGYEYILVVIDYFTKWVEAASYSVLKAKHVARFIEYNIISRYRVPQEIISDNGSHFEGENFYLSFNKNVRPRNLKEGDLVLKVFRDETFDPRGKMKPRRFGPFTIKKIMLGGTTRITDLDGEEMLHPINMDRLRRYQKKNLARLKTQKGGLDKS